MNPTVQRACLFLLIPAAVLAISGLASSESARATPATSASASAPPAELPIVFGADVPAEGSPAPDSKEWALAKPVRANRGAMAPCTMKLLREWLRVRCGGLPGAGLVAGDPKGVTVHVLGDPLDPKLSSEAVFTVVVLPLQRGKSRLVSFLHFDFEYEGVSVSEAGTLSVLWRPGRPDPVLVMSMLPRTSKF